MVDNDTNERGNTSTAATQTLGVLELPGVILPGTVVTLTLDDADTRAIANAAAGGRVLLLPQGTESAVGVVARVPDVGALPNGTPAAIVQAEHRARVISIRDSERAGRQAEIVEVLDPRPSPRVEALGRELRVVLEEIANLRRSRRLPEVLRTVSVPGALADAATSWADGNLEHKLAVLAAVDVAERVEIVLRWAKDMLAELQVSEQIRSDVTEGMDKRQREFLLREQMAAIRKELGEGDDDVVAEYRTKVAELAGHLPDKARKAIDKELDRLERVGGQSPEQSWIRTWLDRVLELPWANRTTDNLDLTAAREVLDADHYGLGDVKDRIVEYLAVRKLRRDKGLDDAPADNETTGRRGLGAIVTLVGPPGVGKTSLGESVARAMGRSFVRVALGGVRDEAEIRGHRRTYVGSQPGRIARAISEAGSMNPVVLLDEVDKLSAGGWSGDPTAALLEVLDPAQNHTFRDHYLEIDLDLSDVVFIATANALEGIPGPLLDRMEIVRLDGYTAEEKSFIARRFLLPRQLKLAGLEAGDVVIDDAMIEAIINGYTREAGVRSLERELGKLTRKVAAKVATGSVQPPVTIDELQPWLGRQKVDDEIPERTSVPGVATGLAVTGAGGDVLFVEVTASPSTTTELTLTGQLGDVMKESAQIALSYIASHAADLGVDPEALTQHFHVHVPAGAVPKDGPSAGVTMTTALLSLLTGKQVKPTVGMTGEITLQGLVLPIGGVKQKVLAAHRAGLTEVVLPKRNGPDLDDVPEKVRDAMTFHLAATYAEVQAAAL
jgi:ATP-dependent Lon protease